MQEKFGKTKISFGLLFHSYNGASNKMGILYLTVGSHDQFLDPTIYLTLFQPIDMLNQVTNFFELE